MLKIYNLKDRQEYIEEVAILTQKEWGKSNLSEKELKNKILKKIEKIKGLFNDKYYCKLILLDNNELIGFISIFPKDCKVNLSSNDTNLEIDYILKKKDDVLESGFHM